MINMTTRPLRILVVDDDPAMVGAITALVGTEGHQVITAYDGLTAVRRFREDAPDLVLLDLAMPGPDGFTVAGQMRAAGDVPILVVSGAPVGRPRQIRICSGSSPTSPGSGQRSTPQVDRTSSQSAGLATGSANPVADGFQDWPVPSWASSAQPTRQPRASRPSIGA